MPKTAWFVCKAVLPGGKVCNRKFATPLALEKHANKEHPGMSPQRRGR